MTTIKCLERLYEPLSILGREECVYGDGITDLPRVAMRANAQLAFG